jgi:sporulation protein YlmC with PRC-barrel domain
MPKPEKILAQELLELEVLDLTRGETLGSIVDLAITRDGRVALIGLLPVQWYRGGLGLAPGSIAGINRDCICLAADAKLSPFEPDELETFSVHFGGQIQGKPVLQDDGVVLGELVDFSFNLDDGRILDLVVQDASEKRVRVPVEAFRAIGRDYVVIQRGGTSQPVAGGAPSPAAAVPAAERSAEDSPGGEDSSAPDPPPAVAEPEASALPDAAPEPEAVVEPAAETAPATAPEAQPELSRAQEKAALFGPGEPAELTKFDQKKRDFLRGRKAHRDIAAPGGEVLAKKGAALDDATLGRIIDAGLLGEVFIEMTLSKKE